MYTEQRSSLGYELKEVLGSERDYGISFGVDRFSNVPSTDFVLRSLAPLPAYAVLLGMCSDGAPLYLSMLDPATGPILMSAADRVTIDRFLFNVVHSICAANDVQMVNILVFTPTADELWTKVQAACLADGRESGISIHQDARNFLQDMSARVDRHLLTQSTETMHVCIIVSLEAFVSQIGVRGAAYFKRILPLSPYIQVWPIACVDAAKFERIEPALIRRFGTHVIGHIPTHTSVPCDLWTDEIDYSGLVPGVEVVIVSGEQSEGVWIPNPIDTHVQNRKGGV